MDNATGRTFIYPAIETVFFCTGFIVFFTAREPCGSCTLDEQASGFGYVAEYLLDLACAAPWGRRSLEDIDRPVAAFAETDAYDLRCRHILESIVS